MRLKIEKETIYIISAVLVAIAAMAGVLYVMLNDGEPRVKLVPVVSSVEQESSSEAVSETFVQSINGEWYRTEVSQEAPATLEIDTVTEASFKFQLHARNLTKTGSISGEAYFDNLQQASFTNPDTGAQIIFKILDYYTIEVSHTAKDTDLGCDDTVTFDGKYTQKPPVYNDVSSDGASSVQAAQTQELTKDLRKDEAIVNNIKSLMSEADYNLYKSVMSDENIRDTYPPTEAKTDKNGNTICVDGELNAVKYYAVLNGASTEILLMCKPDGKVYVAIYEIDQVRYYTNDKDYKTKAPSSIITFADSRPAPLKYM